MPLKEIKMNNYNQFIDKLKAVPQLSIIIDNFIIEWGDDLHLMLFGEIGRGITESFSTLLIEEKKIIFSLIEESISDSPNTLDTYVTTGLLEAMYNKAQNIGNWNDISECLLSKSLAYLNQWIHFGDEEASVG